MSRAEYAAQYRRNNPDYAEREKKRVGARNEALEGLARRHPAEFTALYSEALEKRGVSPLPLERPCGCGGTIRRKSANGRWPTRCGTCRNPRLSAERDAGRQRLAEAAAEYYGEAP